MTTPRYDVIAIGNAIVDVMAPSHSPSVSSLASPDGRHPESTARMSEPRDDECKLTKRCKKFAGSS